MKKSIVWAVEQILSKSDMPVITGYAFAQLILKREKSRVVDGFEIDIRTRYLTQETILKRVRGLNQLILRDADFRRSGGLSHDVYQNPFAQRGSSSDVACIVDPSAYVSHLSAMQQYGLTNRLPNQLILTIAGRKSWYSYLNDLKIEFEDLRELGFNINRTNLPEKLRGMPVKKIESNHLEVNPPLAYGGYTRVSSIGRCFLDMLSRPELCGGMNHVIEVIESEFDRYSEEIVQEIDQFGSGVDKVRAGVILDELLNIDHPILSSWHAFAQPGGTRKLISSNPFNKERYSEKWMIALND